MQNTQKRQLSAIPQPVILAAMNVTGGALLAAVCVAMVVAGWV